MREGGLEGIPPTPPAPTPPNLPHRWRRGRSVLRHPRPAPPSPHPTPPPSPLLQNGLTAALSSAIPATVSFFTGAKEFQLDIRVTRGVVLVINIPLIVLGTRGYNVLQLFLLTNMLCCTSAIPVMAGLFGVLHPFIGGASVLFSCLMSIVLTSGGWAGGQVGAYLGVQTAGGGVLVCHGLMGRVGPRCPPTPAFSPISPPPPPIHPQSSTSTPALTPL